MEPLSIDGRATLLPWVTLPYPVTIDEFTFRPVHIQALGELVHDTVAQRLAAIISAHVDQRGVPLQQCTLLIREGAAEPWNVELDAAAQGATRILAIACLSEQRLMARFFPHLNATMFRLESFAISSRHEHLALHYPRRGGSLLVGGYRFGQVMFQQPFQIEATSCERVNEALACAISDAETQAPEIAERIHTALEVFLLGHSETPDLATSTCVMLSAIAFEKLLGPFPGKQVALLLADAVTKLWAPYADRSIAQSRTVRRDPAFPDQLQWPVHKKWAKELYEARSASVHAGAKTKFSVNWDLGQHMVASAYAFPLLIKLLLCEAGTYELQDDDISDCQVFDHLLDSDWGNGADNEPEWDSIVVSGRQRVGIRTTIQRIMLRVKLDATETDDAE
ncbi:MULTISPECIES: hypothetical protein [unclassified Ensifer]|uniref:hypothetical protein n=1 Tax=unclassified Ensifer TaxID=2633371 RepID=UPI000812D407|nr:MULTISPECIES: hypothetical protein [unclassified Ensifer]OCP22086.1 hypothetical protein BC363_03615 [Ensifer sp. LC384]OCP26948.1 hypothetical protein BC361_14135 [Ensifer sp. LC54]